MNQNTIILLHGWGGSLKSLKKLDEELVEMGFKTLRLEMPGHGQTKEMNKAWEMKNFVEWVNKAIKSHQINDYILVGHSFGGKIMLANEKYKILKPNKLIFINANGIKPKNSFKKIFWRYLSTLAKPIKDSKVMILPKKLIYKFIVGESDYNKTEGKINLRESFKLFNEEHFDHVLEKIDVQTLILWGSRDTATPLWMGEKMHSKIKQSKMKIFDETHGLPLKRSQKVAKEIYKFLNT